MDLQKEKYPKVLIIHMSCINKEDQHGVSFRNWFANWRKEDLAQIYSGGVVGNERFCGHNYQLRAQDRKRGKVFFKLKQSSFAQSGQFIKFNENDIKSKSNSLTPFSRLKHQLSKYVMATGIWELIFPPILSPQLINWVEEFHPDLIYAQGYSISFAQLPVMLHKHFGLPLCFQTGDDWPKLLYKKSILAPFIRPKVDRSVEDLIEAASMWFTNGDKMNIEYTRRYHKPFIPIMMCDDFQRYQDSQPVRLDPEDCVSIVYSGGLAHNRWKSLIDLSHASRKLLNQGIKVNIHVFTSNLSIVALDELKRIPNITIHTPLSHEEVPGVLKGADILFLPETFDPQEAQQIALSISTKAHIYMMSERPILVYGSPDTGVVDYARRDHWAYIVDEQNINVLKNAILKIVSDADLRNGLIGRAIEVANLNHKAATVQKRFRDNLCSLVKS